MATTKEDWDKIINSIIYSISRYYKYQHNLNLTNFIQLDDLRQEGWIAVDKANKTFDPSHNVKETTYGYHVIKNHLRSKVREALSKPAVSIEYDIPKDDSDKRELECHVGEVTASLSDAEKEIFKKYFYDNMTLKEIAKIEGVSPQRIHQRLTKILDKIRCLF